MAPKLTSEERARIVSYLKDGKSQNWTAKKVGRSPGTVGNIAHAEGIAALDIRTPKKANEARRDYSKAERLELLNELFDHARTMLPNIKEAKELQALTITIATAIDKRRLEDGEATERKEQFDPANRKRIKHAFDELAQRRRLAGNTNAG
jgi:transposase